MNFIENKPETKIKRLFQKKLLLSEIDSDILI